MKQVDVQVVRSSQIIFHSNIVNTSNLIYSTIIAIILTYFF